MVEWSKIKAEYIAGGISYRELAKKHEISFNTLKDIAVAEGWYKLRQQAHNDTTTKIVKTVSEKNAEVDDTYFRCVDKLMKKAEELIETTPIWQPQMLKDLATTLKYLKECKGVKSEADMREQEARIKKLQKEAEKEDDTVNEIEVTFKAGPEEWNE